MKTLQDTVSIEDALRMIYGCRDAATLSQRLGVPVSELATMLPKTPQRKTSECTLPKKLYRVIFKVVTRGVSGAPRTVRIVKIGMSKDPDGRADTVLRHLRKLLGSENVRVFIHNVRTLDCDSYPVEQQEARILEYLYPTRCFDRTLFVGASECFTIKNANLRLLGKMSRSKHTPPKTPEVNTHGRDYINSLIN